jgi:hypothetical protein
VIRESPAQVARESPGNSTSAMRSSRTKPPQGNPPEGIPPGKTRAPSAPWETAPGEKPHGRPLRKMQRHRPATAYPPGPPGVPCGR